LLGESGVGDVELAEEFVETHGSVFEIEDDGERPFA
jgi:hypothetical protein